MASVAVTHRALGSRVIVGGWSFFAGINNFQPLLSAVAAQAPGGASFYSPREPWRRRATLMLAPDASARRAVE
jgi:hypothetical protein